MVVVLPYIKIKQYNLLHGTEVIPVFVKVVSVRMESFSTGMGTQLLLHSNIHHVLYYLLQHEKVLVVNEFLKDNRLYTINTDIELSTQVESFLFIITTQL